MSTSSIWSLLVLTLPTENATARMRFWRALKSKGCAVLRDGIYLLPHTAEHEATLRELADAIADSGARPTCCARPVSTRRRNRNSARCSTATTTTRPSRARSSTRARHLPGSPPRNSPACCVACARISTPSGRSTISRAIRPPVPKPRCRISSRWSTPCCRRASRTPPIAPFARWRLASTRVARGRRGSGCGSIASRAHG